MYRLFFFFLVGFLSLTTGNAQLAVEAELRAIATDAGLRNAGLSVAVIDVSSNQLVASFNPKQSLRPASSIKLLTTASALIVLGPDHRFETRLEYSGYIDEKGTLHGNIFIVGGGDPTLGSPFLDATPDLAELMGTWVKALKAKGIRAVEGCVIGDASAWQGTPAPSDWSEKDGGNYYAAGSWALNIHENMYFLPFEQAGKMGATPGIGPLEPEVPGMSFRNEVRSAASGSGDNAYIYGRPHQFVRAIRGTIPVGSGTFTIKGSVPDGPLWTAQLLQQELEAAGVEMAHIASTSDEEPPGSTRQAILVHQSPPLETIIERANKESVNLYCEALLRSVGEKRLGVATREAGIRVVREVWEDRGIDFSGANMSDGSGLSLENAISGYMLAQVARKMYVDQKYKSAFFNSLAVAGQDGTLAYLLKGTEAEGRIWAKSGSMKGVRSYTGFARGDSGKLYAFSMIANDFACSSSAMRKKFERLMLSLVKS
jgi:D-alanyl-D-alanine carboxypeptidase/D-alanyl-D-alanine-endopeptidase (penicillin-binding protein 4)